MVRALLVLAAQADGGERLSVVSSRRYSVAVTSLSAVVKRRGLWSLDPLLLVPVALLAWLVVAGLRAPQLLDTAYWYGDFPEAFKLGQAIFDGTYGHMTLPVQTGIGPLWLAGAAGALPLHRALWTATGALMAAIAIGFMVRGAAAVTGWRGALVTGALAIAVPPVVGWEFLSPIAHVSTLLVNALLAWQVVTWGRGPSRLMQHAAIALLIGVLVGVGTASDPLLLLTGVLPWAAAVALIAARRPRVLEVATLTAVVGALAWVGIRHAMSTAGIDTTGGLVYVVTSSSIVAGLRTSTETAGQMITGVWYGTALPVAVRVASAGVVALAVGGAVAGLTSGGMRRDLARGAYATFWLTSAAALLGGFVLSGLGVQAGPINLQGHYLDSGWFAVAGLAPLWLRVGRPARHAVAFAAAAVIALAARGVAVMPAQLFPGPDYNDLPRLQAVVERLGLHHGYGGYWESYGIDWHTDDAIQVRPLQSCAGPRGASLCPYAFTPATWYSGMRGPSFVVLRSPALCGPQPIPCIDPTAVHNVLPAPRERIAVGDLTLLVYDQDPLLYIHSAHQ